LIYFDGTYSHTFSGNSDPTPRYDYNPIMYRLDLADPRLTLPVAVYRHSDGRHLSWTPVAADSPDDAAAVPHRSQIAFFACDRPSDALIPVFADSTGPGRLTLERSADGHQRDCAFYALPSDLAEPPPATTLLYEYAAAEGRCEYSTDPHADFEGFRRRDPPFCRVWPNPFAVRH
jgi:hypothetical protein